MSFAVAGLVFAFTALGGLLGIRTREALPEHHLGAEAKELVRLCMGLVATMTALILGLVTASANGFYEEENAALHHSAADLVMLDHTLAEFGPETQEIREQIRETIAQRIEAAWSGHRSPAVATDAVGSESPGERVLQQILALSPRDEAQRWLQAEALALVADVIKTRWLSLTETTRTISPPFLVVIVFWLCVLFWSFGLFAPRNGTVLAALLLASISVAASVLLILEMQAPYSGLLQISSDPLRLALENLGGPAPGAAPR
jgi:hypothetical protein